MAKTRSGFLLAEGWYLSSRKKQGCMIIERWSKPGTDWHGCSQGQAYQVARDSKKWREAQAKDAARPTTKQREGGS